MLVEMYHNAADARPVADSAGASVLVLPTSVGAESGIATWFDLIDNLVNRLSAGK